MIDFKINLKEFSKEIENILVIEDQHSCERGEEIQYTKIAKAIVIYLDEKYTICKS